MTASHLTERLRSATLAADEDGPPLTPPSSPRATTPVIRRASAIEQATQLSRDPVIVGALVRDLLLLTEIKDAIGALYAAQAAVVDGDHEAMRVEVAMAIRCLNALTTDRY